MATVASRHGPCRLEQSNVSLSWGRTMARSHGVGRTRALPPYRPGGGADQSGEVVERAGGVAVHARQAVDRHRHVERARTLLPPPPPRESFPTALRVRGPGPARPHPGPARLGPTRARPGPACRLGLGLGLGRRHQDSCPPAPQTGFPRPSSRPWSPLLRLTSRLTSRFLTSCLTNSFDRPRPSSSAVARPRRPRPASPVPPPPPAAGPGRAGPVWTGPDRAGPGRRGAGSVPVGVSCCCPLRDGPGGRYGR
jgi:hypothetical protein